MLPSLIPADLLCDGAQYIAGRAAMGRVHWGHYGLQCWGCSTPHSGCCVLRVPTCWSHSALGTYGTREPRGWGQHPNSGTTTSEQSQPVKPLQGVPDSALPKVYLLNWRWKEVTTASRHGCEQWKEILQEATVITEMSDWASRSPLLNFCHIHKEEHFCP